MYEKSFDKENEKNTIGVQGRSKEHLASMAHRIKQTTSTL